MRARMAAHWDMTGRGVGLDGLGSQKSLNSLQSDGEYGDFPIPNLILHCLF